MKKLYVVNNCHNTSIYKEISFFSTSDEALRNKWKNANPLGWKNLKFFFVCSEHFLPTEITTIMVKRLYIYAQTITAGR